jgi:thioredoxin-dependent peroxiredoxin
MRVQMRAKAIATLVAALALALPATASAELSVGTKAPLFTSEGAQAGKAFTLNLARALKKGPVVLYFFPRAFTKGCTLEAHAFAEAMDSFQRAGASVIGLSGDNVSTLRRFSTEACRDKFPVANASPQTMAAYDVNYLAQGKPTGFAKRTSYVIGQDGRVAFVHSDPDYRDHVRLTLAAVERLRKR